ncbi:hypothetical protein pdam_00007918 [Pocillopora damicornis]|uniref:Uncharacterized protein n=1 Tax=Pocillopora damicornis TaxID=46731 RepID=A0A3M6UF24_POCDA|nr:hypothetical protein pdam_00007918 [Pocillopora damicornis]
MLFKGANLGRMGAAKAVKSKFSKEKVKAIGDLKAQPSALTSANNQNPPFSGPSTRDSLPKLRLHEFDDDLYMV